MRWRIVVVVVALVLGSGCSVKFAYNNLDRFARWGASDYVNMNDEQREYFDAEFAKLHDWHRINHLPRYADLLESLPQTIGNGIDAGELLEVERTMMGWGDELEERGTPMVIGLMRSMTDEQVARLPKKLDASNKDIARPETEATLDDAQEGWRDEVAEIFSQFVGRLSSAQRKYLASQSVRYLPERVLWVEYRRRWQADLMLLLEEREDAARFAERFNQLAGSREAYYGEELSYIFDHNEELSREVGRWLLNHMTEGQHERLFKRLLEFAVDFRELAVEVP